MAWTLRRAQLKGQGKQPRTRALDGLTYEVADLNTAEFPKETYDAVYVHAALHHVFHLEHLLDQIKQTLKPGGLFVVHEYIGPSQMQFPGRDLELADAFLNAIPERYRQHAETRGASRSKPPFAARHDEQLGSFRSHSCQRNSAADCQPV